MPLHMMVLNLLIDSLMPPSTDTPEVHCFFSLGPNPKEDDRNDSDALAKVTCLCFCDKVTERAVEDG
jgi:hypothetical protein